MTEDIKDENKNIDSKQENNQDVQGTQESQESQETQSKVTEPDVVSISPGLVEGPGKGVLEKIASVFRKPEVEGTTKDKDTNGLTDGKADSEHTTPGDDSKGIDKEVSSTKSVDEPKDNIEYEEIDQKFVNAAELYGWSNERIIEYAENHDDLDVVEMTTRMEKSIKDNRTSDKSKQSDSFINEEALKTLAEENPGVAQAIKDVLDPLAKRFDNTSSELDTLKGKLGDYELDRKSSDESRAFEVAGRIFDSSGVQSLGKTKDIPKYPDGSYDLSDPVVQERDKVWNVARQFYANGGTFEGAMKEAMQWYHGSNANKDIKRKIIKDLKEQEARIMPIRQEVKIEKEYASEEERKAAVINDALRKYNKELPA